MRFRKAKEKYTGKEYWVASEVNRGMGMKDISWIIRPLGAGFNLFRQVGFPGKAEKLCHVRKFESAKQIANLMQNG